MKKLSFLPCLFAPYFLLIGTLLTLNTSGNYKPLFAGLIAFIALLIFNALLVMILYKTGASDEEFFRMSAILKLLHIPFFLFVLISSILIFPFTVVLLLPILLIEYALVLSSGLPGIIGLVRSFKKEKKFPVTVHLMCHFILCLDVLSAVYLAVKQCRKKRADTNQPAL